MARGQRPMQRTARNYRAYDQSQRSSRVTADVVYRLGYVPKPVDVKTTIGLKYFKPAMHVRPSIFAPV